MEPKNHIFLMYCGFGPDGKEYRKWTTRETEPLVVYKDGQTSDCFFPAFLLLGIKSGKGRALIPGFGPPGGKDDWLAWLEDIFLPGHNLEAIAQTVEAFKVPPVDIWAALPYPDPDMGNFGLSTDRSLDLSSNGDRTVALKWWINRFLARWHARIKARGLDRFVTLQGFYWPRESMTPRDRLLLPAIIPHIRSLGCRSLWIPYYAVTPFLNITNPGFDITIIQPSYLQNPGLGWQRLAAAVKRANKYGAGIEIEFDTNAVYENSPVHKIALDYLNRGLPQFEGYMSRNFIAYYTGYKTVLGLFESKNPLYKYLYRFVKGSLKKIDYPGINY
ncbi:MAG: DUF4855 domain-containing protein [Firmicutes bacterium]|nr:DUF4855 domain-containing protein [Bacillota bacterium]